MKIYVCDDEPQILAYMSEKIKALLPESRTECFSSGRELKRELEQSHCDILFLDIDMPEIDGMDIADSLYRLACKPLLIFVTSHDELVYESLRYHPFGFIRKSFFDHEIEKVLSDCQKEMESGTEHFNFRITGKNVTLILSDILYFEADGNYLKIFTSQQTYRFRSTMTAVENSLLKKGFIRIHKGFLVNQSAVKMIGSDMVELMNGNLLPIGRSYAETTKKQILRYMRL